MNEIVNKFLLTGDKFMPERYLKQPWFTYSACEPFTNNKERIHKLKETEETNYIYKNKLDKVCFQHDMAYGDFKDLKSAKNPKYLNMMDIKEDLLRWFINVLTKSP